MKTKKKTENSSQGYITQRLLSIVMRAQEDVKEFRKNWGIPRKRGFSHIEKFTEWHSLHLKPFLTKDPYHYFDDYEIDPAPRISYEFKNLEHIDYVKLAPFSKKLIIDAKTICDKYGLEGLYFIPFFSYLFYGAFLDVPRNRVSISQTDNKKLSLDIYESTTIKDVAAIWKEVKEKQKILRKFQNKKTKQRNKPDPFFKRNKKIYELRAKGKTYKEIKELIKKQYGQTVMEFELPRIVTRFKKKHIAS